MSLMSLFGNIDETIKENHTSEKLFGAADACLYDGVKIVLKHTYLYEECLSIFVTTYTRKRIFNSDEDRKRIDKLIYKFFFSKSIKRKLLLLKKMKLNRDLLFLPLRIFAENQALYCRAVVQGKDTHYIKKSLYVRDLTKDLTPQFFQAKTHADNYLKMREVILEKYYRLIVQNVGKMSPVFQGKVDLEDVTAEYYTSSLKAFAKFDIMSGPFTSYLKGWFKNAKTQAFNDEIGVAFLIPSNERLKVAKGQSEVYNFGAPLENFEEVGSLGEIDLNQNSDAQAVRQIVKMFDRAGLYRLVNEMEIDLPL